MTPSRYEPECKVCSGPLVPAPLPEGATADPAMLAHGNTAEMSMLVCVSCGALVDEPDLPTLLWAWWATGAAEQDRHMKQENHE